MYNYTKISKKSRLFISELSINGVSKRNIVSLALAKIYGDWLQLPSEQPIDIKQYFNTTLKTELVQWLYELNELCAINVDEVSDYIYKYYLWRVLTLYPTYNDIDDKSDVFNINYFNIDSMYDKETLKEIEDNSKDLSIYIVRFTKLLKEVKGVGDES